MDVDSVKTALQLCELFTSLDGGDLDVLMENGEVKELPRGKILYMKGAKSDDTFCLVVSGSINVVAKDGHVVKEIGESELIGEVALSNPYQTRTVTVIAKEPTEILEWNINHIKEKIPGLWKKLLKLAWKKMNTYYEE